MHVKSMLKGALVGALVLVGTVATQAATLPSTGASVSGGLDTNYSVVGFIPGGPQSSNPTNTNANWFVTAPSYTAVAPYQASVYSNGAYAQSAGFTYLSANADGAQTFSMNTIVYQVTFSLGAATTISGTWAADNGAVVYNTVNNISTFAFGLETTNNDPASNYNSPHSFSFLGQVGLNTLNFFVTDGGGPSAFAVNVAAVPGPIVGAGLPGLVMAVAGILALRRRRMAAA